MLKRFTALCLPALCLAVFNPAHAAIPTRAQIDVTGYVIHVDLDPATGRMTATAAVTFTPLEDLNIVTFGLNNGLSLTSVVAGGTAAPVAAAASPQPAHGGPVLRNHAKP